MSTIFQPCIVVSQIPERERERERDGEREREGGDRSIFSLTDDLTT